VTALPETLPVTVTLWAAHAQCGCAETPVNPATRDVYGAGSDGCRDFMIMSQSGKNSGLKASHCHRH
jgi:hypothetical protein